MSKTAPDQQSHILPVPPPSDSTEIKHVIVTVLENTSYDEALQQPFISQLIKAGGVLSDSHGVRHPSQPNYLALVGGQTYGVSSDSNKDLDGKHIGDLLAAKGLTWKLYAEGYPGNCFKGSGSGNYKRKHNPFISFKSVQQNAKACNSNIVSADSFFKDWQAGSLPNFAMYIPDIKNDGHDTGASYADHWLSGSFGPHLQDSTLMRNTLFILTFDEDDSVIGGSNHILTVFYGPSVVPASSTTVNYSHYNILRTIEVLLGTDSLGQNDSNAVPVTGIWAKPSHIP